MGNFDWSSDEDELGDDDVEVLKDALEHILERGEEIEAALLENLMEYGDQNSYEDKKVSGKV